MEQKRRVAIPHNPPQMIEEGSKRQINYAISKNKGLTAYRRKEARNSRVNNRRKYTEALKRRRGQVREMRSNDKPYEGEATGINAAVVRSIPLQQPQKRK